MDYCDVINLPSHRTAQVTVNKITEVIHPGSGPSKKCQTCFKSLTMWHNGGRIICVIICIWSNQGSNLHLQTWGCNRTYWLLTETGISKCAAGLVGNQLQISCLTVLTKSAGNPLVGLQPQQQLRGCRARRVCLIPCTILATELRIL